MFNIFDWLTDNPILLVLILVGGFGTIVLAIILVRKFVPAFKNNEQPKSDKEIAEEEVNRLVVDIKGEEKKQEEKPLSEEEAVEYEMSRVLEESDDPTYQKQAEEYQKEHPEEGSEEK